jgi:hypothetical protein
VPDSTIIAFEIYILSQIQPEIWELQFYCRHLEKFDPKNMGNFVSICSRTRDTPGGNSTRPGQPTKYFILDIRRVKIICNVWDNKQCGFKLKLQLFDSTNPRLFDKSRINPQHLDMSRYVVDLLWTRQQIHNKSKQWSMAFDLSTKSRKAVQQIEKLYKSTANPQLYDKSYNLLYN